MTLPFPIDEYRQRQSRFSEKIKSDSIVIIPTNDPSIRSNDVHFPFRANSYMLYLCGWEEAGAFLVISKHSDNWESTLFVTPRDTKKEIWEGIRIGVEGAVDWPVDYAESIEDLEKILASKIDNCSRLYSITGVSKRLDKFLSDYPNSTDPRPALDSMRRIKSSSEIDHMSIAADIASKAHTIAMKKSKPGMGEWQIQSFIEGMFTEAGSETSFQSIVGSGDNATVLHYNSNNSITKEGDLILVDAGCEIHGYASDITRTWPISGKFSEAQKEIYEIVLTAELEGIRACIAGSNWSSMHQATSKVIAQGLIDLGILNCPLDEALGGEELDGPFRNYFMHGTGHFLGLDVHDVGGGRQGDDQEPPILEPGMVLTIEPGLYFGAWRNDVPIPERYAGMGIRIEDDVLITEEGPIVLSSSPKSIDEIERIVGVGEG